MQHSPPDRLTAALSDRYRIERELGQGGMATVYLAQDLKHDRKVAVKVLRPELAAVIGAERFLAEIKTTANLQHPHILGLIDSGDAEGFLYYVMPYVEGESLRDRLDHEKQLPVDVAVRITSEVASALDYAHRHNVIHRDIKPENILLHDGSALVADFGIALAAHKAGSTRMTETGMSLGTPHYMSPEQAMGERELTARSDVYALGCVLYEMLVGEPPFTGPTAQSIVAKVMTDDPRPQHTLRRTVPPAVEDAVLTALEKLPADRFASAAEFATALAGGQRGSGAAGRSLRSGSPRSTGILAALLVLVAAIAFWGWLRPAPPSTPPSRLAILAPGLGGGGGAALQRQLALSPDGGTVFFVSLSADGGYRLMRQPLSAAEPVRVDGTAGISSPLVSADGRWIFGTRNGIASFRIPVDGGSPIPLPEGVHGTAAADWGRDGELWFSPEGAAGGIEVAALGHGDSIAIPYADVGRGVQLQQVLPGGQTALVAVKLGSASGPISRLDLKTGRLTPLLDRPVTEIRYTAGYLLWAQPDGTLQAQAFDPAHPRIDGSAVTIATGISITGNGLAQLAVAPNGTVAYIPEEPRSLQFIDRSGSARAATPEHHNFHAPEYSPDGRRLSTDFNSADGRDVWILSLDDGTLSRATFDRDGHDATWTPDGRFITYASTRSGALGIYRKRPGSAEPAESLFASRSMTYAGLWFKDGRGLLTTGSNLRPNSRSDVAILENAGSGPLTPLVASPFEDQHPALSPDNHWVAFVSDQSGEQQVYVRPYPAEGDQVQVSLTGGNEPLWSPDGRELYYRGVVNGEPTLIAAAVRTVPDFAVTARTPLFSVADYVGTTPHINYSISPDGKTFAMVRRNPATRIMIIQNLPGLVRQMQGTSEAAR